MALPEWLARCVTYPLHERLRGRRTLQEMKILEHIATLTPEALRVECAARLRALLRFAAQKLPYYAETFARARVNPAADDPFVELAKLPVLRKPTVRANADRMINPDVAGGLQPGTTGGTSGDTLHFYMDRLMQSQNMGCRLFMQGLHGVRPGDRRMWLWGSPIESGTARIRRWRDRLINEIVLDAFEMSAPQMDAYLRRIGSYQPRLVFAYPSAMALLARHAAGRYRPRDFPWLRLVVLTGDEVSPDHRRVIADTFGCRVVSEYGAREVGLIAHEFPRGRMHVVSPHVHVEIIQDGEALGPGRSGAVVCTNLNTRAQPLIRYAPGDVAALSAAGCDCGLPFPVIEIMGGRITGFAALPGGRLCHGHLLAYLVRADKRVVEFRVHQRALDAFEVLLVVDDEHARAACTGIQHRFRQRFGPAIKVECRVVKQIPPDPSGKRRRLISDVATEYDRFEVVESLETRP